MSNACARFILHIWDVDRMNSPGIFLHMKAAEEKDLLTWLVSWMNEQNNDRETVEKILRHPRWTFVFF